MTICDRKHFCSLDTNSILPAYNRKSLAQRQRGDELDSASVKTMKPIEHLPNDLRVLGVDPRVNQLKAVSVPYQSTTQSPHHFLRLSMVALRSILTSIRRRKSALNDGWICRVTAWFCVCFMDGSTPNFHWCLDTTHFTSISLSLQYFKTCSGLSDPCSRDFFFSEAALQVIASWLLCGVESSSDPSMQSLCLRKHRPIMVINNNESIHLARDWWASLIPHLHCMANTSFLLQYTVCKAQQHYLVVKKIIKLLYHQKQI